MKRRLDSGFLLIATGVLHTVCGLMIFHEPLAAMLREGLVGTVGPHRPPLNAVAMWCLVSGFLMMALGGLYRFVEIELGRTLPARAGVVLLAIFAGVVLVVPASGAWLLLPQGVLIIARARREQAELAGLAELQPMIAGADHVDVKTVEGTVAFYPFIAAMIGYQPAWVTALYWVRRAFVRLLGMRQAGVPRATHFTADTLPRTPGAPVSFFRLRMAIEDRLWVADVDDKHLRATLGVVLEPGVGARRRLHVFTIVHYKNWAGPIYFNLIRPFHHLVVTAMMRAGLRAPAISSAHV